MANPRRSMRSSSNVRYPPRPSSATSSSRPHTNTSIPSSTSALRSRSRHLSYKELSSSDNSGGEDSDEGPAVSASTQAVVQPSRSARRSLALRSSAPSTQPARRQRRTSVRHVHYAEGSSTDDFEQDDPIPAPEVAPSAATKRRLISPHPGTTPSPKTRRRSTRNKASHRQKAVQFQAPKSSKTLPLPEVPSDGVIPPWQTLPYDVLLSVFRYALYPAHDEEFRPTANVNWLVHASRVCKAFAEPALSALYESPPLLYRDQPHDFFDIVSMSNTYFDYRYKVKRLDLDSKKTLAYSHSGRGNLDIAALVSCLPNLSALDISSGLDRPPYRQLTQKGKWWYPENLFQSLSKTGIRLKEWRWAGHMIGKFFAGFQDIHLTVPFQSLTTISLSHLWLSDEISVPGKYPPRMMLPSALNCLHNLQGLTIMACHSERWKILENLPNDLKELSIIMCPTFDTGILQAYLADHGQNLLKLVLNHNHALDLRWLVDLKVFCPRLQTLTMDLTYFSTALLAKNSDAEPVFDALLWPEDVPSWPSTLVEVEMLNLRKWSPDATVTFFESILSSSNELKQLRRLVIKAMIDISWRDRAKFREKWIGALTEKFLRKSPPPSSHLASSRAFREWKSAAEKMALEQREKAEASKSDSDRRVTRLAKAELESGPATFSEDEEKTSLGTCEVVEISIDNMRPTEIRLSEADFMDSEISGDEEWTGQSSTPQTTTYAW